MREQHEFLRDLLLILISGLGGFLLSLTGMTIGWMVGTMAAASCLSLLRPDPLKTAIRPNGIAKGWLNLGQMLLGIELGQKINMSVMSIFKENWLIVSVMLLLSVVFAMLSGFVLWRFSKADMLTSFVGTAPGGLSAMPGIAQEVGANTAIVSLVQMIRVLLVVMTIPFFVFFINSKQPASQGTVHQIAAGGTSAFAPSHIIWTALLVLAAFWACKALRVLRFPAPWLLGSMISAAVVQIACGPLTGFTPTAWWPHGFSVLSQVCLGATIGSKIKKEMFIGARQTLIVALAGSVGLIIAMILSAAVTAKAAGISLTTAILAFAPGGIAEMATTSVSLHADSTFVVAVQVLRVVLVIAMLPPFFRLLHQRSEKSAHPHMKKARAEG
ncbi:AbrB family transcriptional regulator [Bacillus sp. z60-18]|uniref:AbrB family transcriptional regulator n=1 Tax=unclassified Bacillus (in: firmicutes) TaxID=185979 RepID=UPI00390C996A